MRYHCFFEFAPQKEEERPKVRALNDIQRLEEKLVNIRQLKNRKTYLVVRNNKGNEVTHEG
jgi:hypothetical protein